tara:strand:- start:4436 stop:5308 length:873 start_codon:yes stop_codon:yes gene_type:complete
MENKLLCYTGAATGRLLVSDCSCSVADSFASHGLPLCDSLKNLGREAQEASDVSESDLLAACREEEVKLFNDGTLLCSKLTHVPTPESMWPSREAFLEAVRSGNLSLASQTISVLGRQCYSPQVGITAEERSETPPKMLPWEYRFSDSGASACSCPTKIEHRSRSYPETVSLAKPYFDNLFAHGRMNPDRTHPFSKGTPMSGNPLDSCLFFRSGYAFVDDEVQMASPIIGSSSRNVNLDLDAASSGVPLYPGANGNNFETCGDESLSELSQYVPHPPFSPTVRPVIPRQI